MKLYKLRRQLQYNATYKSVDTVYKKHFKSYTYLKMMSALEGVGSIAREGIAKERPEERAGVVI